MNKVDYNTARGNGGAGIEWEAVVLEVDVVDVGGVDGVDAGVQRRAVVGDVNTVIVVRVAAGARQEREVAQLRLLAGACVAQER